MEADQKEEKERHSDSHKKLTRLLRSRKKRSLPTAGEKPERRRHTKRPRFSSPLSSNEGIETGNWSDFSELTPSKTPRSNLWPASRMTVIYERQRWEGNTIDERYGTIWIRYKADYEAREPHRRDRPAYLTHVDGSFREVAVQDNLNFQGVSQGPFIPSYMTWMSLHVKRWRG